MTRILVINKVEAYNLECYVLEVINDSSLSKELLILVIVSIPLFIPDAHHTK